MSQTPKTIPLDARFIIVYLACRAIWGEIVFGAYSFVYLRLGFILYVLFAARHYLFRRERIVELLRIKLQWLWWPVLVLGCRVAEKAIFHPDVSVLNWSNFVSECVIAPGNEEIFFRGIVLGILMKDYPKALVANVVVATLVFVSGHLGLNNLSLLVSTICLGLILGFCFVKTKSLSLCILCHFAWNFLGFYKL